MSKKGLFMIAVVLGFTVALLALAPAIAGSGGATRAEVADDSRISSARETDLAAVYAQKVAVEDPVLEQGTGPATTGESDYAAVPETDERAGLVTGYPRTSLATTRAIKVARDDAVQLPPATPCCFRRMTAADCWGPLRRDLMRRAMPRRLRQVTASRSAHSRVCSPWTNGIRLLPLVVENSVPRPTLRRLQRKTMSPQVHSQAYRRWTTGARAGSWQRQS